MATNDLAEIIADAARRSFVELFEEYPNDTFYYCSLTTTGEGHTPYVAAWSYEKLDETVEAEGGGDDLRRDVKWSYADSPLYCYGEAYFEPVKEAFTARSESGDRDSTSDRDERELRLKAMEEAMARLDSEGVFGAGERRRQMVIHAEVMPPDYTNVERARRLNRPEALETWLEEAAEPAP